MHNIYPTNIFLCKIKRKENNTCSYCNDVDFIEQFFFYCPIVYDFRKCIEQFILHSIDIRIQLQVTDILFGMKLAGVSKSKCINHVILIAKMCISIFKKTNSLYPLKDIFETHMQVRNITS